MTTELTMLPWFAILYLVLPDAAVGALGEWMIAPQPLRG